MPSNERRPFDWWDRSGAENEQSEGEREEWLYTMEAPPGYREDARLDVYITRFLPNASRAKVQQGIRDGRVTVNEKVITRVSYRVQASDQIACLLRRPPPTEAAPENIPLNIVYEDDVLIVVNKAAGMVVHPAYGNANGTLVNALLYHVGGGVLSLEGGEEEDEDVGLSMINAAPARQGDPSIRPGIVHRLDKDTSGLMVVAKNDVAHRFLARQFEERTIFRRYFAIVWGHPEPKAGRIEGAIGRDPRDRKKMAVVPESQGKHAVTHYETLERHAATTLLRFRLETGRTHQIRVHARHRGHPVLGDATYDGQAIRFGPSTAKRRAFFQNLFEIMPRQALHAAALGFIHPVSGEEMRFESGLPEDMQAVLSRLESVEPPL